MSQSAYNKLFTVILTILCFYMGGVKAQHHYAIDYLTIDTQLPQNEVTAIIQDRQGFMWFGTRGGLARYDGHAMKVFQYEPSSTNSLSNNSIESLFEDSKGNIWVGTKSGGLNRFNPLTECFKVYQYDPRDSTTISGNRVVSITEDKAGRIWVGTWKNGLSCLDNKTDKFSRHFPGRSILALQIATEGSLWIAADHNIYKKELTSNKFISKASVDPSIDVTSMALEKNGETIWFGGWISGLWKLDLKDPHGVPVRFNTIKKILGVNNNVYALLLDKDNSLWTGFWGGGLFVMDQQGEVEQVNFHSPSDNAGTDYEIVLSIFQDRSGTIWVGTDGGGVCKIQEVKSFFKTYNVANSTLSNDHILGLFEDSKKTVWIGTKASGINTLSNGQLNHPEVIGADGKRMDELVYTFHEDKNGTIWFGTPNGLHQVTAVNKNRIYSRHIPLNKTTTDQKVMAILTDSKGRLWVGTQQNGLYRLLGEKPDVIKFEQYAANVADPHCLADNRISFLFEDSKQQIWIGTYNGLFIYDEVENKFIGIHHRHGDERSLSNDIITYINEDNEGQIWVGTPGGLNRIHFMDHQLTAEYVTKKDGLPNDYIHAILFDQSQQLWISSNGGLFEYNSKNQLIKVFTKADGLQGNSFSEAAACKSHNGLMYFGGINGLNVFDPENVPPPVPSPLVFVSLKVMNQEINPRDTVNGRVLLSNAISYTNEIAIGHLDKVISVEVSSIDFTAPEKNQYSFKLEGFDDDWVDVGSNKTVTYTNLKAGNYKLYVRASDVGNIWNDQVITLSIHVLPAPWLTWWAYLLYGALVLATAAVIFFEVRKRLQLKHELHVAQVNHAHTQLEQLKEKELSEIKLRFFTNVSHELRTPLTLISSPLEEMLASEGLPVPVKEKLSLMNRHTGKLLSLVNQLLDFRKTESGNMQLFIEQTEVVKYIKTIFETFSHVASRRDIHFVFQSDLDHLLVELDKNKIEIAVTNIISNAFKYSPDGSKIICGLSIEKNTEGKICCVLQVNDTGRGMPKEALEKIFDLYYQVSVSESMKVVGSGIGLSLVKEVVQAHGGDVTVSSEIGKGSSFIIKLPIKQSPSLSIISASRDAILASSVYDDVLVGDVEDSDTTDEVEKRMILVVDDTEELRNYLVEFLSNHYTVLHAPSGETGLKIALTKIPDLILSDVMMDGMDGFELCQKIKTNEKTSHIPVILLTAKNMPQNELMGLKTGADDYITKPFIPSILLARVKRQLASRKELKEYYSRKVTLQPTNIEITPYDEMFLKKAMTFIEANLLNSQFNNESLEKELGMSHSTLYRKLKALTDLSINEFVRSIRLKRAAQLLDSGLSVSEAAYQTGFSEVKYFRAYFKTQFGCLPSEYVKERTQKH